MTDAVTDNDKRFHDIIYYYEGSCNSMTEEDREFLETNNLTNDFDELLFECETCGWWCGDDDRSDDDNVCTECEGAA